MPAKKPNNSLNFAKLAPVFADADKAREFIEELRWKGTPNCPHCESEDAYKLTPKPTSKRPGRKGLYKCNSCRKQFTVTVGTIFESSRIPLNKWLYAIYMMCSSKKGISAYQLHRELEITYKSAWFLCHRIRHAMTEQPLAGLLKGTIEADETYVGGKKKGIGSGGPGAGGKTIVFSLVERDGKARSFVVDDVKKPTLQGMIRDHVDPESEIHTDQHRSYGGVAKPVHNEAGQMVHPGFKAHESVDHSIEEYSRGDVTTNTAESFFALFKRGIVGAFHHISKQHTSRYLGEFDFRWNRRKDDDGERFLMAIIMGEGKRLFYRVPKMLAEGNPA